MFISVTHIVIRDSYSTVKEYFNGHSKRLRFTGLKEKQEHFDKIPLHIKQRRSLKEYFDTSINSGFRLSNKIK